MGNYTHNQLLLQSKCYANAYTVVTQYNIYFVYL